MSKDRKCALCGDGDNSSVLGLDPVKLYDEGWFHARHHTAHLQARIRALEAEVAQAMNMAGEVLGTDPEHRTLIGCVWALSEWAKRRLDEATDAHATDEGVVGHEVGKYTARGCGFCDCMAPVLRTHQRSLSLVVLRRCACDVVRA